MMNEQHYQIPRYLDEPFRFIVFTMDELVMLLTPFLGGLLLFDAVITGLCIGVGGVYCLKKLKGDQGQCFVLTLLYWHLPGMLRFRVTPASHQRCFVG